MRIRPARRADLTAVFQVEMSTGPMFAAFGMSSAALDGPPDLNERRDQIDAERVWAAVDDEDRPVGFLALEVVDGDAHIAEVAVEPAHGRRGIGRELIEHVAEWACAAGFTEMSLTTYAEVPWNAPYYERCGFRVMDESAWTPGLRAIREAEIAAGLDEWPRVCMNRPL
jgi:GNAT superfamily N-acetyltransferase